MPQCRRSRKSEHQRKPDATHNLSRSSVRRGHCASADSDVEISHASLCKTRKQLDHWTFQARLPAEAPKGALARPYYEIPFRDALRHVDGAVTLRSRRAGQRRAEDSRLAFGPENGDSITFIQSSQPSKRASTTPLTPLRPPEP